MFDVQVINHGSLIGFLPMTQEAKDWIDEKVDPDAQYLGRQLMVEPRYAGDIVLGMAADGLEIDGDFVGGTGD
jgi:hypothetical protein